MIDWKIINQVEHYMVKYGSCNFGAKADASIVLADVKKHLIQAREESSYNLDLAYHSARRASALLYFVYQVFDELADVRYQCTLVLDTLRWRLNEHILAKGGLL